MKENTEVIIKREGTEPWCEDPMFYMLTADGLMVCRNHEFFTSCAPAKGGPDELANQKPFMKIKYPRLPGDIFEQICGWFEFMAEDHGEAAALILYHAEHKIVDVLIPKQECSWGSVDYEVPPLEPGWRCIGDIHSHVNMSAYSSYTDKDDEAHRPGVHIVVGKIDDPTPDFHAEVVVDGHRFKINDLSLVIDGDFRGKAVWPKYWMKDVTKKKWLSTYFGKSEYGKYGSEYRHGGMGRWDYD